MRCAFPVLFAVVLPSALAAQPVMNQADAPQEGDVFPYITVAHQTITASGADVLWDLSGIGTADAVNLPCEAPGATGFGDLYPTATIALDGGSVISYMRADAT